VLAIVNNTFVDGCGFWNSVSMSNRIPRFLQVQQSPYFRRRCARSSASCSRARGLRLIFFSSAILNVNSTYLHSFVCSIRFCPAFLSRFGFIPNHRLHLTFPARRILHRGSELFHHPCFDTITCSPYVANRDEYPRYRKISHPTICCQSRV
jgi:hypothetical protein